jgi:hypothetical protein
VLLLAVSVESRVRQVGLITVLALEVTTVVVVLGSAGLLFATSIIAIVLVVILLLSGRHFRSRSHLVLLVLREVSIVPLNDLLGCTVAVLSVTLELSLTSRVLLVLAIVIRVWLPVLIIALHLIEIGGLAQRSRVKYNYIYYKLLNKPYNI